MSMSKANVGNGIIKQSARPTKIVVDSAGEYWICDASVDSSGDLGSQGCSAHSDVHLVK